MSELSPESSMEERLSGVVNRLRETAPDIAVTALSKTENGDRRVIATFDPYAATTHDLLENIDSLLGTDQ